MKALNQMTREELLQVIADQRAGLERTLKALTPPDRRKGPSDIFHKTEDAMLLLQLLYGREYTFFLFVAHVGDGPGRRANFGGNMERECALNSMAEFLTQHGRPGDWLKHTL